MKKTINAVDLLSLLRNYEKQTRRGPACTAYFRIRAILEDSRTEDGKLPDTITVSDEVEGEKPRHTEALSCFAEESTTRDCQGVGHYMCRKCGRLEAQP